MTDADQDLRAGVTRRAGQLGRRVLRAGGLLRPRVTVLVDARGAAPEALDATLHSVRATKGRQIQVLVAGATADGLRVARRHTAEDWRLGLGDEPDGDLVLALLPGDLLAEGAVDALTAALDGRAGADVAVGQAADAVPSGRDDLLSPPVLGRAAWRSDLWREAVRPAATAVEGYVSGLLAARDVVTVPTLAVERSEDDGLLFGAMPDPTPELDGWLAEQRAVARLLHEAGDAELAASWSVRSLLDSERFLDAAERMDEDQWSRLQRYVGEVVGDADPERLLAAIPAETRVKVWLARQDDRRRLEEYVVARRPMNGHAPTVVEDGVVRACLPFHDDPHAVPPWCFVLQPEETPLVTLLRSARLAGTGDAPALELVVHAFVRGVAAAGAPEAEVSLVAGELRLPAEVTVQADPAVTRLAASRFHAHDLGALHCRVPVAALPDDASLRVEVTLVADGVRRTGPVAEVDTGDATLPPLDLGDGRSVTLVPGGDDRPVRLQVGPAASRRRSAKPTLDEVRLDGLHLHLSGALPDPDKAHTVVLEGPQGRCEAPVEPDGTGRWSARLHLVSDPWGLGERALPAGRYRLEVVDGRTVTPDLAEPLARSLPLVELGEQRMTLRRMRNGRLQVVLGGALADEEIGPFHQTRLQERYRTEAGALDDRLAYFQSYAGQTATDSPLAICEELQRRGADLDLVWCVADASAWHPPGTRAVLWRSAAWYDVMARARYVVTSIELESWFCRRPGQQVLQTFHGYPSKSMGIMLWRSKNFTESRIEQQLDRTSRTWSLLLTPTPAMDRHYREQYRYDGPILAEGYPRDDLLLAPERDAVRAATRRRLGIRDDQVAVLYAPTWRDDQATNYRAARLETHLDLDAAADALGPGYVLLLRGHRFHAKAGESHHSDRATVLDVTGYPEINHLVLASDAAVLDYSSLRFDFALTGRPMVFLVPDLEEYTGDMRGFLYDFRPTAPGPLVATTDEVVAALRDLDGVAARHRAAYDEFNRVYNDRQDGHAAARVVDAFFGEAGSARR